jgi:hypothetical protein
VAPDSAAIVMSASVAAFLASGPNPSWLNKDLNFGLFYRVLTAAGTKEELAAADSSDSHYRGLPLTL